MTKSHSEDKSDDKNHSLGSACHRPRLLHRRLLLVEGDMMTPKQETVLVVLGLRMNPANPMPATIVQRKGSRAPSYQYLSPEQHAEMGDDQTAFWSATFLDGHYWLEHRLPDDARPEAEKKGFVVLHE